MYNLHKSWHGWNTAFKQQKLPFIEIDWFGDNNKI
jgi:hypothetical protein